MTTENPVTEMTKVEIPSSIDGSPQPIFYWAPDNVTEPTPLLVFLHQWSFGYDSDNSPWLAQAMKRNWIYVHPHFRGPNRNPDACGSELARQDILDSVAWAIDGFNVDKTRIYLAGMSGGGHMTMLMAGYYPDHFSAASQWVGISDLTAWYDEHCPDGQPQNYAMNIEACVGGIPGSSQEVDQQLQERSPLFFLENAWDMPIDFGAGVHDGHTGSVPIHHTLDAFNVYAEARGCQVVNDQDIEQLSLNRKLDNPQPQDTADDPTFEGRAIYLRRQAGPSRVTIFEGGHEGLPFAATEWLGKQQRQTCW